MSAWSDRVNPPTNFGGSSNEQAFMSKDRFAAQNPSSDLAKGQRKQRKFGRRVRMGNKASY